MPAPDRIVVIAAELPGDDTGFSFGISYPALNDYREATGVFEDVFAFDTRGGGLTANGRTTSFVYQGVTGNYFTGLQLPRARRPGVRSRAKESTPAAKPWSCSATSSGSAASAAIRPSSARSSAWTASRPA